MLNLKIQCLRNNQKELDFQRVKSENHSNYKTLLLEKSENSFIHL